MRRVAEAKMRRVMITCGLGRAAVVVAAVLCMFGAGAEMASAANTWYVSPGGTGTDCSSGSPCPLDYGVHTKAMNGDTVVLQAGVYSDGGGLAVPAGVTVQGAGSSPTAVTVNFSDSPPSEGFLLAGGDTLSQMTLRTTPPAFMPPGELIKFDSLGVGAGVTISRVDARAGGVTALELDAFGLSTVSNSLFVSSGAYSAYLVGYSNGAIDLYNDTFIGGSAAPPATINIGDHATIRMYNTIARRVAGGTGALDVLGPGAGAGGAFDTFHSDYAGIQSSGVVAVNETAPLTAAPAFVNDVTDLATADYRETSGSATRNAGITSQIIGPVDLPGAPRSIDGLTDMGAYQFIAPPTLVLKPVTALSATTATLNATVTPDGVDTSSSFQYGINSDNDQPPPDAVQIGVTTTPTPISTPLTGLMPNTTYIYKLCTQAEFVDTVTCTADTTFTTLPLAPSIDGTSGTALSGKTAQLVARVNPHGVAAAVHFDYGTTTGYGASTAPVLISSTSVDEQATTTLTGLTPGTTYHVRAVVTTTGGTARGGDFTVTTPATSGSPVITSLTESAKKWIASGKAAVVSAKKLQVGTTFTIGVDRPAGLTLTFTRRAPGRKSHGKCVARTKANAAKPKCKLTLVAGALSVTGHAGVNRVAFGGALSPGRLLAPGGYTLVVTATNAAGTGRPRRVSFTIARKRKK